MNINFELYRVFYSVANNKNITKASQELMISQPAVSKSIKNLEDQLGGKLFSRTRKGVTLTEEGEQFYKYIKQAMEYINNAENKFTDLINLEVGTINIGIGTTLTKEILIPYLEEFHKLYPKIDIQIHTDITNRLFSKLNDGLIDLVILNLPYKVNNDIELKTIKTLQDCFVVSENYKYLKDKKLKLEELNNYPLILLPKASNTRHFIDDFCLKNNVTLNPHMNLSSYSLVVEFTKIGFGIGYVTEEFIKEDLKNKKLFKLDVEPKLPKRGVALAYSKRNTPSFSSKKLIEIILKNN